MRVYVLASGSTGNAAIIETDGHIFLIDAGISCKTITERMQQCGLNPAQISAVFLTHEHNDHIKGLETLMKKYRLPVFTHRETWEALPFKEKLAPELMREMPETLVLENITIDAFNLSHDAAHPLGYAIHSREGTCTLATDFGIVTSEIENIVRESDALILESNHDLEMLKNGRYPYFLKKRILSDHGHLSNNATGKLLAENGLGKKTIFLAHLSQENNRPALAYETVRGILEESDRGMKDLNLYPTFPTEVSRLEIPEK